MASDLGQVDSWLTTTTGEVQSLDTTPSSVEDCQGRLARLFAIGDDVNIVKGALFAQIIQLRGQRSQFRGGVGAVSKAIQGVGGPGKKARIARTKERERFVKELVQFGTNVELLPLQRVHAKAVGLGKLIVRSKRTKREWLAAHKVRPTA